MRKAKVVFEKTKERGRRLIVAADQNIVFEGKIYGKPKNINEARKLIGRMRGSEDVYAYTGNTVILADNDKVMQSINATDIARLSIDNISDETLEKYLSEGRYLSYCGGILMGDANFIHLKEGRMSTARGMTLEYAEELMQSLKEH